MGNITVRNIEYEHWTVEGSECLWGMGSDIFLTGHLPDMNIFYEFVFVWKESKLSNLGFNA